MLNSQFEEKVEIFSYKILVSIKFAVLELMSLKRLQLTW